MLSHDCSINATETQWVKILFEGAFLLISIFFRKNLNPAREGFRLWNSFVVWWISKVRMGPKSFSSYGSTYRKVTNSRLSRLVAHFWIFRLFMKGKFDAYVLWPLAKTVQNWIVDRSTAPDFTVCKTSVLQNFEKSAKKQNCSFGTCYHPATWVLREY